MCQKIVIPALGIPIFAYGFMILCGFLISTYLLTREGKKRGLPPEKLLDFAVWLVLSGVVGARLFYVVQFWGEEFSGKPWYKIFALWEGGMVFYGGVLAGLAFGLWYLMRHKLPLLDVLDIAAPFVPIGMAFGRMGCFLNGCCWGWYALSSFPLAVCFPPGTPIHAAQVKLGFVEEASRTLPVHPWQLYDACHSLLMSCLLWIYLKRGPARGCVASLFLLLYSLGRFVLDGFRGDHRPTFTGLTVSQNLSVGIFILALGGFVLAYIISKGKRADREEVKSRPAKGR